MDNKQGVVALQQAQETKKAEDGTEITPIDPIARHSVMLTPPLRFWRDEPWGPNDREIEIWYNGNWVPAFFSDLKKGDMFLDVAIGALNPGKCYGCSTDVKVSYMTRRGALDEGPPSFMIQGLEILQAPTIKDIQPEGDTPWLSPPNKLLK